MLQKILYHRDCVKEVQTQLMYRDFAQRESGIAIVLKNDQMQGREVNLSRGVLCCTLKLKIDLHRDCVQK